MNSNLSALPWHERARVREPRTQAFIGGRYVDAASGATNTRVNPANGEVLAQVAACDARDVAAAVASARAAFESGAWAGQSPKARKKALQRFAELIQANLEELALLETLDTGKPIRDSLNVDIPATVNCIQWFAEAVDKIYDQVAPTDQNALALITREPLGVVGAIVPWSFPLIMAAWKIGPILVVGKSLVLKPSEKSPLSAIRLAQIASEAGLPDGVFNVVPAGMPR